MPLHVVVDIAVRADRLSQWLALIAYHAGQSRLELGCLRFDVHRAVGLPCRYALHETWAGAAALDSHRRTPHYARWRAEIGDIEAAPRTHVEYETVLPSDRPKIVFDGQVPQLAAVLAGSRVVFTNGCFDVIHAGHVASLVDSRAQGDILVVGLNSDASVRRLKGDCRPVHAWNDRAAVLAAMSAVDYIVPFGDGSGGDGDTPLHLIEKLRPAVLVKGGDYDAAEIVGGDLVRSYGGRVHVSPLQPGRSTSRIVATGTCGGHVAS